MLERSNNGHIYTRTYIFQNGSCDWKVRENVDK